MGKKLKTGEFRLFHKIIHSCINKLINSSWSAWILQFYTSKISPSWPIYHGRVSTMPYGIVRWFNAKTGAGFIRTDDGENVLFLSGSLQDSDPSSICRGVRVRLDLLKSKYGFTAINVRLAELPEEREWPLTLCSNNAWRVTNDGTNVSANGRMEKRW